MKLKSDNYWYVFFIFTDLGSERNKYFTRHTRLFFLCSFITKEKKSCEFC